ncbi:M20/M25/M40 family metallo-hydrolase [Sphingopyxis sp. XHP0097]|uniref:M20/M25/M40 family metallo-hydrolase n=1 Tax=Sphingopyxis jiangsuensis TaxID=2871171 RepID=A0ABS7MGN8_9SPHN|nr:M20/M25/M40 family metallo-hydrolase [Sphingopyxis jiangsuensis]MBY4637849.1 M20/M25/M40 family metallo-hydrolase [Sphingopyxis jiangsuensis]
MRFVSFVALAALQLIASAPAQAELNGAEAAMARTVAAEQERSIALLEKLVNQNSGSLNLEGVEKVGAMMRAELEPLGFTVEWKPMRETGRAGHLIATHKGRPDTKRLLLIAHLDTVFEPDSPFQRFERMGDKAKGPGVGDDKGGMVVVVAALRAMHKAGTLKDANIEFHMTGDEEDTGDPQSIARADLLAAGKRADVALGFEGLIRDGPGDSGGADMSSIARRSSESWQVTATGKTGHSSGIFSADPGDGAIYELARIIHRFRTELPEPNLTFNVGLVAGGEQVTLDEGKIRASANGKTNIIAATAIARGDLRTLSAEQAERVKARMAAIVADHAPGTSATLAFDPGGYPAMAPTDGNRALLARLNAVNRDLGLPEMAPLDPLKRGAADISFVAPMVDSLAGLGAYSTGDHGPEETVDLPSIERQAVRAAILMSRLAAEKR